MIGYSLSFCWWSELFGVRPQWRLLGYYASNEEAELAMQTIIADKSFIDPVYEKESGKRISADRENFRIVKVRV